MKKSYALAAILIVMCICADARVHIEKQAPPGFDSLRTGIAHGKIDTLTYASKTVGATRKVLIYTPPGYSKKKKYPVLVPVAWHWRR